MNHFLMAYQSIQLKQNIFETHFTQIYSLLDNASFDTFLVQIGQSLKPFFENSPNTNTSTISKQKMPNKW